MELQRREFSSMLLEIANYELLHMLKRHESLRIMEEVSFHRHVFLDGFEAVSACC